MTMSPDEFRAPYRAHKAHRSALVLIACVLPLSGHAGSQVRLSDIVFAVDHSGSMGLNHVWISPDGRDTVYLYGTDGCQALTSADLMNYGAVSVPSESGIRQVARINPDKSVASCSEISGDPFSQRALAIHEALDFQAFHAPGSRAGYLGFSQILMETVPPLPLETPAHLDSLKSRINIKPGNSTNYHVALLQAKQWLADPVLSPNPVKALIFLSDGRPNMPDSSSYLEVLSSTYADAPGAMPPVHGIFMGDSNPDSARLQELSRLTGGLFFQVSPRRPDSLRAAMRRVIGSILNLAPTTGARILRNVPDGAPMPTPFIRHRDGSLLIAISPHPGKRGIGQGLAPGKRDRIPGARLTPGQSVFADFLGRIRAAE